MGLTVDFWKSVGKSLLSGVFGGSAPVSPPPPETTGPSPEKGSSPLPVSAMGPVVDLSMLSGKGTLPFTHIVIHHSATKDGKGNDWEAIRKYHMSWRVEFTPVTKEVYDEAVRAGKPHCEAADRDIGYNLGVEEDGGKVVVKYGRMFNIPGAHTKECSMNRNSVGICCVGNFDKAAPSKAHWDVTVELTKAVMKHFNIPASNVHGHREVYDMAGVPRKKTCPGSLWDMGAFRKALA